MRWMLLLCLLLAAPALGGESCCDCCSDCCGSGSCHGSGAERCPGNAGLTGVCQPVVEELATSLPPTHDPVTLSPPGAWPGGPARGAQVLDPAWQAPERLPEAPPVPPPRGSSRS